MILHVFTISLFMSRNLFRIVDKGKFCSSSYII